MSKLIDLLEKAGTQSVPILGFRPDTEEKNKSDIVSIGQISEKNNLQKKYFSKKVKNQPNVFLLNEATALNLSLNIPKNIICGIQIDQLTKNEIQRIKKLGIDFVIFDPTVSEASILNETKIGKIPIVKTTNSEEENRALAELPVDAIYIDHSIGKSPITFQPIIEIQKITNSIEIPSIISCEPSIETSDLETIRNIGVRGIISPVKPETDFDKFIKTIKNLPIQKSTEKNYSAISPSLQESDEDDFNDDDFDEIDE